MTERGYRRTVNSGTIRQLREIAMLTQQELAERAGVSRATVSNYERGAGNPPNPRCVRLIAEALKADPRELVTITFD